MNIEERITELKNSFIKNITVKNISDKNPNSVYVGYEEYEELMCSPDLKITSITRTLNYKGLVVVPVALQNHLTLGFVIQERSSIK